MFSFYETPFCLAVVEAVKIVHIAYWLLFEQLFPTHRGFHGGHIGGMIFLSEIIFFMQIFKYFFYCSVPPTWPL